MKHPFSFLRESEYFPHARTLRTSLWQKFKDSFRVFYGDMSYEKLSPNKELTWGLFDVFSFGIPALVALAKNYVTKNRLGVILEVYLFAVDLIFNTVPRFIFSALFALVAFVPITLPVYLVSKFVDHLSKDSLDVALSLKKVTVDDRIKKFVILKDEIQKFVEHDFDLENIECVRLDSEIKVFYIDKNKPFSSSFFSFNLNSNEAAIKALFSHNIGGIAVKCPERARELAEEQVPALRF